MSQPRLAAQIEDDSITVDLGQRGVDTVTGFRGVVTSITLMDHAAPRIMLESYDGENGITSEWLDAGRVKGE